MIEFVKKLQKHNVELAEEIKELKEEREAILRILDSDKTATDIEKIRNVKPPKTLAEALEENETYGTFKCVEKTEPANVSMSMKFNRLTTLYRKTRRENNFTKEEVIFIQTLAKYAMRDITDEHYKDLVKIAQKSL